MKYECIRCRSELIAKSSFSKEGLTCPICRGLLTPTVVGDKADEKIKMIESKNLEVDRLIDESEIETALNILNNLQGHLIIRADKILDLCKKAIKYEAY